MNKVISTLVLIMSCMLSVWGQAETVTLQALVKDGAQYVGETVSFTGKAIHVCSKSGMKLFMEVPGSEQTFRINSTKELGKFPRTCNNHQVEIIGTVEESRIDEAFLKNWETQIKAHTDKHHGEECEGCEAENSATKATENTTAGRIAGFRKRIAQRSKKEGKDYLSFYYVIANNYHVLK